MPTANQLSRAHQPAHYFVPPSHQNCGTLSKHTRLFTRFYSRRNPSQLNRSAYLLKALETKDDVVEINTELFPHECVLPVPTQTHLHQNLPILSIWTPMESP